MPDRSPVFHILSMGWDHPAWTGAFYPDDLPEEWRLSYFANEFPGVVVPQTLWQGVGSDQLMGWVDDVGDQFRFYLMLSRWSTEETCRERALLLGDSLGGYIVDSRLDPLDLKGLTVFQRRDIGAMTGESGRIAVGISSQELGDLRAQRGLLETLVSQVTPSAEVLMIVQGSPPGIQSLINLNQLVQLMGLA